MAMRSMVLLAFWIYSLAICGMDCIGCPDVCVCFMNHDPEMTFTVDCRGQDLTSIPTPPNGTTHLDLSNNIIQSIRVSDFSSAAADIIHLQLQNNEIMSIEPGAFSSLTKLETLIIYNNYQLVSLENGTFEGLMNLKTLTAYNTGLRMISPLLIRPLENIVEIDFSFNQLRSVSMGTFENLKQLKILSLSNNFISSIEVSSFNNLPSLHYLSLDNNQIVEIPPMAFMGLDSIKTITLSGNPIDCSCSAVYLYQFLRREQLSGPTCEGPEQFTSRQLLDLAEDEFCALPTATISPSETVILSLSSPLQLNCTTTGLPPPQVSWSRNGMSLEADDSRIIINDGTLIITETNVTDSGEYHCSASSTAGLVSSSVEVAVLESTEPTVTEAVVRDNVVLDCSSEIPPGVSVHWIFNSSTLAPASDKYAVLRNGSLLIVDLWLEDMGNYTCQVGDLSLVRRLILKSRPEIILINEGPCAEPDVIRIDSDVFITVLRCVAFGIPAPIVQWVFEMMVLERSVPPAGMIGGEVEVTFEIIRPTANMNSGNYSCIASNEEGIVEVVRRVIVRDIQGISMPPPDEIVIMAGETAVIECPIRGNSFEPGYVITWMRGDGVPLPLDRITFTCNNRTLVIRKVASTFDIGEYICDIREPSGRRFQSSVFLRIVETAVIDRMCGLPVVVGMLDGSVELLCPAEGNPPVDWIWTRGGEMLENGGRINILDNGARLRIFLLQEEDSGLYNCTVRNMLSFDSYIIQLIVYSAPEFVSVPNNTSVVNGNSTQLPCSATGIPSPSITWWRVTEDVASQVVTDGVRFVTRDFLLITKAFQFDEGFYYCNLSSVAGTVISQMVFIDVLVPPTLGSFRTFLAFRLRDTDEAKLECSGSGDPEPDVEWFRLPQMIPIPSMINDTKYVRNGSNLVILNVRGEDAGVYRCWVANTAGQVFQDVEVTVIAPPETSVEPSSLVANVGCLVMFVCLDGGKPPLDFQWLFNGDLLAMGPELMILDNGKLILSNVQIEDSGNYSCTVRGYLLETTRTAILTVRDPVFASGFPSFPPSITSPTPSRQFLTIGQTAQFVCLAEGFPVPQVIWLKDEEPQPNFRRVVILNDVLRIRDLRVTDTALYECVATNALGEKRVQFQLNVTIMPFIVIHPIPKSVFRGDDLVLSCSARGAPPPIISWQFNGDEILSDGRRVISPGTLTVFNSFVESDTGLYTCLATSDAGIAKHSANITIREPMSPPRIVIQPESQQVVSGSTVVLLCDAVGDPPPNITWMFEDNVLQSCSGAGLNPSRACLSDSDSRMVIIQETSEDSEGSYLCEAENPLGVAGYEISVNLTFNESLPQFILSPLPQWVRNGSMLTLDCVATGNPLPNITWLLNMEPVNLTTDIYQQLPNGTLVVTLAREDTVGLFTCVADNDLGVSQATVEVDVVPAEENVGFSRPVVVNYPLGILTMFPGQSKVLDCSVVGSPAPVTFWTKNGVLLDNTSFPETLSIAENGSLILSAVRSMEEGNYTCTAANQEGASVMPFALEISDDIISGSSDVAALSHSALTFQCSYRESAVVMWQHEERILHESENVGVEGNGSLVISTARMIDAGKYTCLGASRRGWKQTNFHLYVIPRKEPPFFTQEPEDIIVVKKDYLILHCKAASPGGETTAIRWFHEDKDITNGQGRRLVLQDYSLLIINIQPREAGNYTCIASNQYGESRSSAVVTVSRLAVDEFIYVREGSTVGLSCALSGEVEWVKDDRLTLPSYNRKVWLFHVNHTHQGDYTCSHGKQSINYYLVVRAPPRMTTPSRTVTISPGDTISLHCVATGRPAPKLSWHHGGHQLKTDNFRSILANGTLLLYEAESGRDGGVYTCKAQNIEGTDETRILLSFFMAVY